VPRSWLRSPPAACPPPATLDAHPHQRVVSHLRQALVADGVLDSRDEELARTERWLTGLLDGITSPPGGGWSMPTPSGR